MLKSILGQRLLLQLSPDDNSGNGGDNSSQSQDDNGENPSNSQNDDNGQDSSTEQQGDNQSGDGQQPPPEDADAPPNEGTGDEQSGDQQNDQQDGEQQETFESEQPVPDALVDKPGDEKLRYSSHPRWKEMVTEKNQYKAQVEQQQSAVEQTNALNSILSQHAIPVQEFQSALQYLILKRTNPQEAFRQIARDYTVLGQLSGEVLPDDLQAQVAAAALDPNIAKELARARAQTQYQQWQQTTQGQMQQFGLQQVVAQTTSQWTQTKQLTDPDFKQGTKLWTTVDLFLKGQPAPTNAMQAQLNCENAYKQAKDYLKGFAPQQRNGTPQRRNGQPPSRPSSPTNRVVVKTTADAINALKAGGGKAPANITFA